MIHVKLDGQNVSGYEMGTRSEFDQKHAGNPNWMFLDNDFTSQILDLSNFYRHPQSYYIDQYGAVQQRLPPPPDPFLLIVTEADGTIFTDTDGKPLAENIRFTRPVFLTDRDSVILRDNDSASFVE